MSDPRQGFTRVHAFPEGDRLVSMIEHQGRLIVATDRAVYELVRDKLVPLEVVSVASAEMDRLAKAREAMTPPPCPAPPPLHPKPPKRAPRNQQALEAAFEQITRAAGEPPPDAGTEERARAFAVRSAQRRGWKRVSDERKRIPPNAERGMVHGVEMWRPR